MGKVSTAQSKLLTGLLNEYNLEKYTRQIQELGLTTLNLLITEPEEYEQPYGNRLGGVPDLPHHLKWPLVDNRPLRFIAQFNLAQLPELPGELLPARGMLYFFMGDEDKIIGINNRVLFWDVDTATLDPENSQREVVVSSESFQPFKLQIEPAISLPGDSSLLFEELNLNDEEIDSYYELREELQGQLSHTAVSRIGGYPESLSSDPAADAFFESISRQNPLHESLEIINECLNEARDENNSQLIKRYQSLLEDYNWFQENQKTVVQKIKEWCLLFEIDSHNEAGMNWWDSGRIHFMINRSQLAARNFSEVYAGLLSS